MAQDEMTAKAMLVQTKYTEMLMNKAHVMGVGIGLLEKDGVSTGEVCLVVMVDKKVPPSERANADHIPEELDGVKVDVREIGVPTAF